MNNIYRNPYFNFEIQFPESWRLSYWKNRKKPTKTPEKNQVSYDDLPDRYNEAKSLFVSYRRKDKSTSPFSNLICIESVYRRGVYDVATEYPVFEEQIHRKTGSFKIDNVDARSLYIESEVKDYVHFMNIIYWKMSESIWLRGNIQGDSKINYNESLEIFSSYKNLEN